MFKYQKKELRISSSEYAEYIDDEKTTISVKGVLHQNMFSVFFSEVNPMPGKTLFYLIIINTTR